MMYKNDFVAVVKVDNKILREDKDTVLIPFGSEYSILMKNLQSRKAVVSVTIDGQDVLNGKRIVINPKDEQELKGFYDMYDSTENRKFKFIQKTEKIQEYRGDKIDDGILRIEFWYEEEQKPLPVTHWDKTLIRGIGGCSAGVSNSVSYSTSNVVTTSTAMLNASNSTLTADVVKCSLDSFTPQSDEGITVRGSESDQKFRVVTVGNLESQSHVITLKLKGYTSSGTEVKTALAVGSKVVCPTCGHNNKSISKYCSECGTYLK